MTRLNKYLSEAGVCSRREADRLIQSDRVTINGRTARVGDQVDETIDQVRVDGKDVASVSDTVLLAVNKPRGIVCTSEVRKGTVNIYQFLHYPQRIFSIGRLDKDSDGLLLLTNDGDMVNRIMRARYFHEKEYQVKVDKPFDEDFLHRMGTGVEISITQGDSEKRVVTRPCRVTKTGERSFQIVLTQGLNRQIRKMCQELGYRVVFLKRTRIMNIQLGDLKTGAYREVTPEERVELEKILESSDKGRKNEESWRMF